MLASLFFGTETSSAHTDVTNRSEGKKAKGKARKKRGKKSKQLSTSRDERDGEEVSGPSEDEIDTEQTPIYEADASPHSSEDKLILNVLDPLSAIVEEVAWSTGFTRDAVTAMVNVMFDRGLAYDNTEAVIKELNKLEQESAVPMRSKSTSPVAKALAKEVSAINSTSADFSAQYTAMSLSIPQTQNGGRTKKKTQETSETGKHIVAEKASVSLPTVTVAERLQFAARHEDLTEALAALSAWIEIRNSSSGVSSTETVDLFFCSRAMPILIERLIDDSKLVLADEDVRKRFYHLISQLLSPLNESIIDNVAALIWRLLKTTSSVASLSAESSSQISSRIHSTLQALHLVCACSSPITHGNGDSRSSENVATELDEITDALTQLAITKPPPSVSPFVRLLETRELQFDRAQITVRSFLGATPDKNDMLNSALATISAQISRNSDLLESLQFETEDFNVSDPQNVLQRIIELKQKRVDLVNQLENVDKELGSLVSIYEATAASAGSSAPVNEIVSSLNGIESFVLATIERSLHYQRASNASSMTLHRQVLLDYLSEYICTEVECISVIADRVLAIDKKIEMLTSEMKEYSALRMQSLVADLNQSICELEADKSEDISSIATLCTQLDKMFCCLNIGLNGEIEVSSAVVGKLKVPRELLLSVISLLKLVGVSCPNTVSKLFGNSSTLPSVYLNSGGLSSEFIDSNRPSNGNQQTIENCDFYVVHDVYSCPQSSEHNLSIDKSSSKITSLTSLKSLVKNT